MSGHSKWSTIKHKKAIVDKKRGEVFSRIVKQITKAVRDGGSGDPDKNPGLRRILDEAKSVNMPNNNVRRAIQKGLGGAEESGEHIIYEGYAPYGVAVEVSVVTDNRNRSKSEVGRVFDKAGGALGRSGSVAYLKKIKPVPLVKLDGLRTDKVKKMIEELKALDDVVSVWSNLDKISNE